MPQKQTRNLTTKPSVVTQAWHPSTWETNRVFRASLGNMAKSRDHPGLQRLWEASAHYRMSSRPACDCVSASDAHQTSCLGTGSGRIPRHPEAPTGPPRVALTDPEVRNPSCPRSRSRSRDAGLQAPGDPPEPLGEEDGDSPHSAEEETEAGRGGGGSWGPGAQGGLSPARSLRWRQRGDDSKVSATVTSGAAEPTSRGAHLGREQQQQGRGEPRRRHVRLSCRSSRRKVSRQRLRDPETRTRRPCACAGPPLARSGRCGACAEQRRSARWR